MKFVIWSIEHQAWWRALWIGYTETLAEAGIYDEAEARKILQQANVVKINECAIPVGAIDGAAANGLDSGGPPQGPRGVFRW